jgi:hypothetical protein
MRNGIVHQTPTKKISRPQNILYGYQSTMFMAESVSLQAEKLFKAMKQAGAISEDKLLSAEKATSLSKLPKAQCMNAMAELEKKGIVKKKTKNAAVSYYLAKTEL